MSDKSTASTKIPQSLPEDPLAAVTLEFVPTRDLEGYLAAARRLRAQGRNRFLFRASAETLELARACHERIATDFSDVTCVLDMGPVEMPNPPGTGAPTSDAVFLFETSDTALSARLMDFVDVPVSIVAPITEHYFRRRPLFMISVPKSGTHMLFELLAAFNLTHGGHSGQPLSPQHFYFLLEDNSHTRVQDFFRGAHAFKRGDADDPFFATPTLFMYRNPLDMVVSEAYYVADPRNTPLGHYFSTFPIEQRLLKLIGDDPMSGTLRERLSSYYPWLRFPNVIPISYEELVGPQGGGTLAEQLQTIWSLQLKLHIPGCPAYYAAAVFRKDTNTFRQGKINSHRDHLTPDCYAALRELEPDFMREFGYDLDDQFGPGYLPRFVDSFRRRPLVVKTSLVTSPPTAASNENTRVDSLPFQPNAVYAYRGYLIALIERVYCALPQDSPRPIEPRLQLTGTGLYAAVAWEDLKSKLDRVPLAAGDLLPKIVPGLQLKDLFCVDPAPPLLAEADVCGFNIASFNGRFYCIECSHGPLDVQWDDLTGVFIAPTIEEARAYCQERVPSPPEPEERAAPTTSSSWCKLLPAAVSALFRS